MEPPECLTPLPQHPRIPEAWFSYLGDRPADPSKDGGPERARPPPSPAGVNLHSPLGVQPCLALPTPLGHSAHLPSRRPSPTELPGPCVPTPHVGLLFPCHGDTAGTGLSPKPCLPPHPLPVAPGGRAVPRWMGRGRVAQQPQLRLQSFLFLSVRPTGCSEEGALLL